MVVARGRMGVASQIHLASQAGFRVLEEGGNAFDAVIAASAVLVVAIPHTGDLGGDAFLMAKLESGELAAYNGSGRAPRGFDADKFLEKQPLRGPLTITVPGLVDAWEHLASYARLPLEKLFRKAISLAENGFPAPEPLERAVRNYWKELESYSSWRREFASLIASGEYVSKPKAHALRLIARRGPRAFYEDDGGLTSKIVEELESQGVAITVEDFRDHRGEKVNPLSTELGTPPVIVRELPPNSQGYTLLQLAKSMRHYLGTLNPLADLGAFTRLVEAVYSYRDQHLGDPNSMDKTMEDLLNDLIIESSNTGARDSIIGGDGDTTFLTAVDKWGNQVGFIQSLYYPFGSGIVAGGILFQNRALGFSFKRGLPNSPAPGKRPLHTLSITLVEDDDRHAIIGCAGGDLRPQIHLNLLYRLLEGEWNLGQAVRAPRTLVMTRGKHLARTILTEDNGARLIPPGDYELKQVCPTSLTGIVQASIRKKNGIAEVVADPRSTGVAIAS